ncbi:MAG TPA: hypothetical protein GXX37_06840 [Clostridiaceae bacterium]|nr:hypothetical protein [Clostridiaceae bacterium]
MSLRETLSPKGIVSSKTLSDKAKNLVNKAKYAFYRILFLIFAVLASLTFGLFAFLIVPLSSYYLFNDFKFWKYTKYFFPMVKAFWRFVRIWLTSKAYRKEFSLSLTAPPMSSPDLTIVKVRSTWNADIYDCNQCTKCCQVLKCPLLDTTNNLCRSYNSFFWRYFACGRYPVSKEQIDFYNCPKWEMR